MHYLTIDFWNGSLYINNIYQAREEIIKKLSEIKPKQIISVQEKKDEIVVWYTLAKAELLFSEWSRPERYGSTSEPYTPCSYPDREPEGFIKSVCCRRSMLVVEMCQIQLED
jgi:hypothetical protein